MSEHKAREARRKRLDEEASERAKLLAIGAALLLSGEEKPIEEAESALARAAAIRAVSELLDDAERFALAEVEAAENPSAGGTRDRSARRGSSGIR